MMRLRAGVASDRGLVRPANEDSFFLRPGLYAVCDGMGGARGGEVASQMACLGLLALNPESAGQQDLRTAVINTNQAIVHRSLAEDHLLGMGTTLTAVLVRDWHVTLAHVGDSRAYLFHEGDLFQLTEDHSWVGEMVRRGEITPAQASIHPHRSVITRALGTDGDIEPDLTDTPVSEGDLILLCSDGLTGMVADSEIAEVLGRDEEPQKLAELLVASALAGGGEDNVTVVVVEIAPDGADGEGGADPGPFGGQIMFGPSDRGALVTASSHRGRRAGAAVRERLGRHAPSVRPVTSRPAADAPAAGNEPAYGAEPAAGDEVAPAGGGEAAGDAEALQQPAATDTPGATTPEGTAAAVSAPAPAAAAAKPGRRRRKWLFLTVAILLVVVVAIAAFAVYNSTVYYVGVYNDGTVALYRGLPGSVLGIDLSSAVELGTVKYESLDVYQQQRVDAHELVSKEDGQVFLRTLAPQS